MDQFTEWRGIQNAFTDMVDRPEWVHSWLERLTRWHLSRLDQYEPLGHGAGRGVRVRVL